MPVTATVELPVKAMPRLAFSVSVAVVVSWAPLIVTCPGVTTMGAVPSPVSVAIETMPPLMVVEPVNVLTPLRTNVPEPFLITVPVVVEITPLAVVLPDPETVSVWPAPPTAPRVSVPESEAIVAPPAPSVIAPDQVLALARFRRPPPDPMPVPMRLVIGSAIVSPVPSISMAVPDATVVALAVVPNDVLFCAFTLPALTVVLPV